MALMFPRLARNFAKAGYFPTDEATLTRALQALAPAASGALRILDPCAGEGVAIAEVAHRLGRERCECFAVEYDAERARHAATLTDRCLRSDLMDCLISRQGFGLLWLNPPYGDVTKDQTRLSWIGSPTGRQRLEKLFYQRAIPLLQYGGVLVFILPHYVLDAELCGWLSHQFSDLRVFAAPEQQFKQVVVFGIRTRSRERGSVADTKALREALLSIGSGQTQAPELPQDWTLAPYVVPKATTALEHFYRLTLEPEQLAKEISRLGGLWSAFALHFAQTHQVARAPARQMSDWHLALCLAAGAISGVIRSRRSGRRTLIVKGATYKDKLLKVEASVDDEGVVTHTRTLVDRFVPVIKAWDVTGGAPTFGRLLTISSGSAAVDDTAESTAEAESATAVL